MKMLKLTIKRESKFNFWTFFFMVILLALGCLFVYSASYYSAEITYNDKFFFLKKQIFGIAVGFVCYLFFSFFDYKKFKKLMIPIYIFGLVMLALVFIPGVGVENYGATRWVNLGFITFQPSEIAKFAFIVASAGLLSERAETIKSFKGIFLILLLGGLYCLLIILEPNMSITICMALLVVTMLFLGGARLKHFLLLIIPAIFVVVILIVVEPYRLDRLIAFLDPFASKQNEGFQLVQSILGVSLGGAFGVGIFSSRQKYLFLPFSESDFIFSIIAEEIGFVGSIFFIFLFLCLFMAILKVARRAQDKFGFLLASGIGSLITIQVLLNLGVCLGLLPPTGLPLPFISAGSTSIMVFMAMLGVVQNVHRQSIKMI